MATQIFISAMGPKIAQRTKSASSTSWTSWAELSYDIPTFYKDYSTLAALATAVGNTSLFIPTSNLEDPNDFDSAEPGCYQFFSATYFSNAPRTGIALSFKRGAYKFQMVLGFSGVDQHLILKSRYYDGSAWKSWQTIDFA